MLSNTTLKIRRALLSVSDKKGLVELAQALVASGAELVATGRTAVFLKEAGLSIIPIEKISGSPEAFQGRMKTLSFPVCSGILYRREDASDELDLKKLGIQPIDCVVVNFYPFEAAADRPNITEKELTEEIDIGGPTLVRAAAKNSPDVLVLTDPSQYARVIENLKREHTVSHSLVRECASECWEKVKAYDLAIASHFGVIKRQELKYGENPHQKAHLEFDPDGPIAFGEALTANELSYNNILDASACYGLLTDLAALSPDSTSVVVIKHNNPCGIALIPKSTPRAQLVALERAWEGDPVSAFGGVIGFTEPLTVEASAWLSERFVELVLAPQLEAESEVLKQLTARRKNMKAVAIKRLGEVPRENTLAVPGGRLVQTSDLILDETFKSVTEKPWDEAKTPLARFGVVAARVLKSNALSIVREIPGIPGSMQLIGAGQGQPNRIEALAKLALPRAQAVPGSVMRDCILVSDAFFPFRDAVDVAHEAGIRMIVQPGGSIKDQESIRACNEHGIAMAFTGTRHFRH